MMTGLPNKHLDNDEKLDGGRKEYVLYGMMPDASPSMILFAHSSKFVNYVDCHLTTGIITMK